jgi:hypothetical protein
MRMNFKDLNIGDTFVEKSTGIGARKGIISTMTYQKIDKSSAKIVAVSGDYGQRHIGGVKSYSPYSGVWI